MKFHICEYAEVEWHFRSNHWNVNTMKQAQIQVQEKNLNNVVTIFIPKQLANEGINTVLWIQAMLSTIIYIIWSHGKVMD